MELWCGVVHYVYILCCIAVQVQCGGCVFAQSSAMQQFSVSWCNYLIYACRHVRSGACVRCMSVCLSACLPVCPSVCLSVRLFVCNACMHTATCRRAFYCRAHTRTRTRTHTHMCICICMYACMYVCMYVCIFIYLFIYMYLLHVCICVRFFSTSCYVRGDEEARAIRHRLRLRLGALTSKKLVSGKSLHDACRSARFGE